jgi:GntR family transcriptional regulator/MocR family aminotransferase
VSDWAQKVQGLLEAEDEQKWRWSEVAENEWRGSEEEEAAEVKEPSKENPKKRAIQGAKGEGLKGFSGRSPIEVAKERTSYKTIPNKTTLNKTNPNMETRSLPLISFDLGRPDLEYFPREEWNRCMYEQVRRMTESPQEEVYVAEGHYELREAISQHLRRTRGFDSSPERIVIVNGSMQAIALLTQILVDPGDAVVVESPGYPGPGRAVQAAGGMPIHAGVDGQGLIPQPWNARLLFTTPNRQFPTGAVLGLDRRQQLLSWAAEHEAVVVEDDYDSEFRHRGHPLEPLKALDQEGRVVYIGTFSKTMRTGLRIGYIVLPSAQLHDAFVAAKRLYEPHPSGLLEQRSLAAFMASGAYARHLRRMRRVYAGKFHLLRALLQESGLSTLFEWVESDAGLHLFGWWRGDPRQYAAYAAACLRSGVSWADAGSYLLPRDRCGACFGFSHLSEEEMREGVARMQRAWMNLDTKSSILC